MTDIHIPGPTKRPRRTSLPVRVRVEGIQDPTSWIADLGSRILDPESWFQGPGSRILAPGSQIQDAGCRIRDPGCWIQDPGSRILDLGSRIQNSGSRIQDPGTRIQEPRSRILGYYGWEGSGQTLATGSEQILATMGGRDIHADVEHPGSKCSRLHCRG